MVQLDSSEPLVFTDSDNMNFCGTEFWNSNYTWYTESPYFTRCFQSTVLVYLPSMVFLLLMPLDILSYLRSGSREVPWGPRIKARLVLNILIAVASTVELVLVVLDFSSHTPTVFTADVLAASLKTFTFCVTSAFILASKHSGQVNSASQFFFWLSSSSCQGLTVGSLIVSRNTTDLQTNQDVFEIFSSCVLALSLGMFILNFFADDQPLYSDLMRK